MQGKGEHSLDIHNEVTEGKTKDTFYIYDERDGPKIFHTSWADGMVVSGWVLATVGWLG